MNIRMLTLGLISALLLTAGCRSTTSRRVATTQPVVVQSPVPYPTAVAGPAPGCNVPPPPPPPPGLVR